MDFRINNRLIGSGHPTYVIAEMSGNHNQSYDKAVEIIHAMKESGADAVKIQTYAADTITLKSDRPEFRIGGGTLWDGKTLHELYSDAYTPWDWQPKLQKAARDLGMDFFSTPFDPTAVDFLEMMDVPAYKVASFELVDIPLIQKIAGTGKPVIMSTGMANMEEITEAVAAVHATGNKQLVLLKCTSAYPSPPESMNLETIRDMQKRFNVPVGLSDHTLGIVVPVAAVTLGACVVEKHFCMSRKAPGPDSAFSLEPQEFRAMVDAIRIAEKALGTVSYGASVHEEANVTFRRSLFAVEDIAAGEVLTEKNVRSIRPGHGLPPKALPKVIGNKAKGKIAKGTPLAWELLG